VGGGEGDQGNSPMVTRAKEETEVFPGPGGNMRRRGLLALVALATITGGTSGVSLTPASQIDFSSTEGLRSTCAEFDKRAPSQIKDENEKIAYVVCDAVQLTQHVWTWLRTNLGLGERPLEVERSADLINAAKKELAFALGRIQASRKVLQTLTMSKAGFTISPGNWGLDLDGDGRVSVLERHFLWVPKPGVSAPPPPTDEAALAEYYRKYYVSPKIRIDQSDVLWAIAYCHFAEFAINMVLSYEVSADGRLLVQLTDADRIRTVAYQSVLAGIDYSKKVRESVLRETDDDLEWIPNVKQRNTSFPLVLDQQSFATWGKVLDHAEEILEGRVLLGGNISGASGRVGRNLTFGQCLDGEGINVRELLAKPVNFPLSEQEWIARCTKPTKVVPMSTLNKSLSEVIARNAPRGDNEISAEWVILRHLYWVN